MKRSANLHKLCSILKFGLTSHQDDEARYLLAGEIELFVGDKAYQLVAGDTFCFRSETGHGYRNRSATEAPILRQPPNEFIVAQVT